MPLFSKRTTPRTGDANPLQTTTVEPSEASQAAAAKIQAIKRGKQTRFQVEQQKDAMTDAATKIQKIKRGHSARSDVGKNSVAAASKPAPASPTAHPAALTRSAGALGSRRVSFSGRVIPTGGDTLLVQVQKAIGKCVAGLPFSVPCWNESSMAAVAATVTSESLATSPPERRLSKLEPKISKYTQEEAMEKPALTPAMLEKVSSSRIAPRSLSQRAETAFDHARFSCRRLTATSVLTCQVKALFEKIDINSDGSITQGEATTFWGKNWAKVNAQAMFNEVDDDANGSVTLGSANALLHRPLFLALTRAHMDMDMGTGMGSGMGVFILAYAYQSDMGRAVRALKVPRLYRIRRTSQVTYEEWLDFWKNVVAQPEYEEDDVIEEIDNIMQGGSWVDWSDGRST